VQPFRLLKNPVQQVAATVAADAHELPPNLTKEALAKARIRIVSSSMSAPDS
jgi:hypothetical protein